MSIGRGQAGFNGPCFFGRKVTSFTPMQAKGAASVTALPAGAIEFAEAAAPILVTPDHYSGSRMADTPLIPNAHLPQLHASAAVHLRAGALFL